MLVVACLQTPEELKVLENLGIDVDLSKCETLNVSFNTMPERLEEIKHKGKIYTKIVHYGDEFITRHSLKKLVHFFKLEF